MILGIDASNIRAGGGVTHLVEILRAADPGQFGFTQVILWAGTSTLRQVEDRPWLIKASLPVLDGGLLRRAYWQRFQLSSLARRMNCALLFVPGGTFSGNFRPVVTMSRNLLPFEWRELKRFGFSWMGLKLLMLRVAQSRTYRRVDGLIFLTDYARDVVLRVIGSTNARLATIPHGIDSRFVRVVRPQETLDRYSNASPFRFVYVSIIDMHKHQWNVAEAVAALRAKGMPITLRLIGPAFLPALKKLNRTLRRIQDAERFITYCGPLDRTEVHRAYDAADACIFASSCENMPNILLEGMASGLPMVCSSLGPMPEVLGEGGVYFNPDNIPSIVAALEKLMQSSELRMECASAAAKRMENYSWQRSMSETFAFLQSVATDRKP